MPDFATWIRIISLFVGYWTAINFGVALVVAYLFPAGLFSPRIRYYVVRAFEKKLYDFLRVPNWKDYLPEAGVLIGFSKRALQNPFDLAYVDKFIEETRKTEVLHLLVGVLGYSFMLFAPLFQRHETLCFWLFFAISTVDLVIQLMFVIVQRYNRPRLEKLRAHLLRRQNMAA